jgi:hypothetical protein
MRVIVCVVEGAARTWKRLLRFLQDLEQGDAGFKTRVLMQRRKYHRVILVRRVAHHKKGKLGLIIKAEPQQPADKANHPLVFVLLCGVVGMNVQASRSASRVCRCERRHDHLQ